jgi:isopentenyl diphosphate isomerase/L-lactate dehydrogenase-like FMN-dependent dehydrogenase
MGQPNFAQLAADGGPVSPEDAQSLWASEPVTWQDFEWIRAMWPGPIVAKGLLTDADARTAVDVGADGVVISNHGGRQLDGSPATIDMLPQVVSAVGNEASILIDGGFRRGADIVRALALGASAVLIGRPYLYGLAVGGETGVSAVLEIFRTEIRRTLQLLGCPSVRDLDPSWLELSNVKS